MTQTHESNPDLLRGEQNRQQMGLTLGTANMLPWVEPTIRLDDELVWALVSITVSLGRPNYGSNNNC